MQTVNWQINEFLGILELTNTGIHVMQDFLGKTLYHTHMHWYTPPERLRVLCLARLRYHLPALYQSAESAQNDKGLIYSLPLYDAGLGYHFRALCRRSNYAEEWRDIPIALRHMPPNV